MSRSAVGWAILCVWALSGVSLATAAAPTRLTRGRVARGRDGAIWVQVSGTAPRYAGPALRRHVRACLAPDARRAPLLIGLRWSHVSGGHQAVLDVTWGATQLGARLLRAAKPRPLLEAAAVAICVALDQALEAPGQRGRAVVSSDPNSPVGGGFAQRREPESLRRTPRQRPELRAFSDPSAPIGSRERHEQRAASPHHLRLNLRALGAVGLVPGVGAGAALSASLRWPAISAWLGGRGVLSASVAPGEVSSSTLEAIVGLCLHRGRARLCPVVSVGTRFSSGGLGAGEPTRRSLNGEAGLRIGWREAGSWGRRDRPGAEAHPWRYGVWLEGSLPWVQTTLRRQGEVVWRRAGPALIFGVEIEWLP